MSDGEEESLAAKKTKQMIARTYGKRNRKKNKLKPVVYGTVWLSEESPAHEEHHAQKLQQFGVSQGDCVLVGVLEGEGGGSL